MQSQIKPCVQATGSRPGRRIHAHRAETPRTQRDAEQQVACHKKPWHAPCNESSQARPAETRTGSIAQGRAAAIRRRRQRRGPGTDTLPAPAETRQPGAGSMACRSRATKKDGGTRPARSGVNIAVSDQFSLPRQKSNPIRSSPPQPPVRTTPRCASSGKPSPIRVHRGAMRPAGCGGLNFTGGSPPPPHAQPGRPGAAPQP